METNIQPVVYKIDDNIHGLQEFKSEILNRGFDMEIDIILEYPTVYIHNWNNKEDYEVYIGESNNIIQRTKQHYDKKNDKTEWQYQLTTHNASLYIVGHSCFNKSLTLDIENRLMHYMLSVDCVKKIHNKRGNPQRKYYPYKELDNIFQMIWTKLHKYDKNLFPSESFIKDSAVFKASPLHKLTSDQEMVKNIIIERVFEALDSGSRNQLIFIEGEAGTGKTVLNSSAFYEIITKAKEERGEQISCYLMVNHDEQITVYSQIARKLGLVEHYGEVVCKPTSFINHHTTEDPIDVAFIDEAHLLLTQGKQAYQGSNQLQDIIDRARVTIVMFDENQILTTEQYWESEILNRFRTQAKLKSNYFVLENQLRIKASKDAIVWIDKFTKTHIIEELPENLGGYEIKIFDKPELLEEALKEKACCEEHKLSRMIATYDWEYNSKSASSGRVGKFWEVIIGNWHKPWNRELEKNLTRKEKSKIRFMSWAEQPHTINEVGSTFTIQGFDLNFAGVILGPSIKYRNGKIIYDPELKNYKKIKQYRTLSDGTKKQFGEKLIQNEVRVLMTRGVEGLYIYACDKELREALLSASKRR